MLSLLCIGAPSAAQWPPLLVNHDDQLALTVTVEPKRPHWIVVRLTNRSNHDVLLPAPVSDCGDPVYGTLLVGIVVLKPVIDASGRGCVDDYVAKDRPIDKRIQGWHRLSAGQTQVFRRELPAKILLATKTVKIAVNAQYEPPYISQADLALLTRARIDVPRTKLNTEWRTFTLVSEH